ncbi:MAG: S-layer homology domain-containing protein [Clostridia bacterium]
MRKFVSILLAIMMIMSIVPAAGMAEEAVFTDVKGTEYYASSAEVLSKLGVLTGYLDGSFGAEKSITRAEMATVICRVIDKADDAEKAKGDTKFADVDESHWACGYINIANNEGIVNGYLDGSFRPEEAVLYEEAVKMVVCALGLDKDITVDPEDWSKAYIDKATKSGITSNLKGEKGKSATRGDIAVMVAQGMKCDLVAPVASVQTGTYSSTQKVTLTTTTEGAEIYYTTDGTEPTVKSTKYEKEISISSTATLKAVTVKKGVFVSDVTSVEYTIKKASSGGGGGESSKSTQYSLSFADVENGSVDMSVAGNYVKNSIVTLTATPNENCVFVRWESNNGGTFEDVNSKTTTFKMPAKKVVITAVFAEQEAIPDEIAAAFGIDPNDYDTDNDGLSNYAEIYLTGTDPTNADSDENGIADADEDADEDGLTNKEEIDLGTDPIKKDTDNDGLNDSDEVNTYGTDPCNYDSDGDKLSDGDEILLGLDPLMKKTDGKTLDSERTFTQELSENNIAEELLLEDNDAVPSLTLTASGNINNSVVVSTTCSNDFSDSRAIVGEAIDVFGETITKGTLTFTLQNEDISLLSVGDTYETFNPYLICKYNDDSSTDYLDTDYDISSNTLSASIDGEGTYFVMNVKNLFDELGLVMPAIADLASLTDPDPMELMSLDEVEENKQSQNNNSNESTEEISLFSADEIVKDVDVVAASEETEKVILMASSGAMAQADIVFIIDTTGSMGDEINNVKNNVNSFVDALKSKGVSAALALVDYQDITHDGYDSTRVHKNGSSNWFYDMDAYKEKIATLYADDGGDTPECAVDALETARLLDMRASAGKIFVLVTDANYKVDNRYGIPSMAAEIELLKNAGVSCSVVSPSSEKSTYYNLYNDTNGIWANIYGNFNTELTKLADKIGEEIVGEGYWIYLQGPVPVPVRLDAMPEEGSDVDTDKDGIADIEELESASPTGEIDLDELIKTVSRGAITGTDYGIVKMYKYKSSPIEPDTDFDGIDDIEDPNPKDNTIEAILYDQVEEGINVKYTMDYRYFINSEHSNTTFNKELSSMGAVFATVAYHKDLDIKSGINKTVNTLEVFNTFGLSNTRDYDLAELSDDDGLSKSYGDDDLSEMLVGHRKINYNGSDKEIIIVAVRGTNGSIKEWSSNFDVGSTHEDYWDRDNDDWQNHENHKGFDVATNRLYGLLNGYIDTYVDPLAEKSIFICGHSRGGAIANLLGARFEDDPEFDSYTYTFASPNVTTDANAKNYNTIFNIINTDDIVTELPLTSWNFIRYGVDKKASVGDDYENRFFGAQEGTWEWLINANKTSDKLDYNKNGHVNTTVSQFGKVVSSRNELYSLPDNSEELKDYALILDEEYETYDEALSAAENKYNSYSFRLQRACEVGVYTEEKGIFDKRTVYKPVIFQKPDFLNMNIAEMAVGNMGDGMGYDVAKKYKAAKNAFVATAADQAKGFIGSITTFFRIGGMGHGHWPETYYLLGRYYK